MNSPPNDPDEPMARASNLAAAMLVGVAGLLVYFAGVVGTAGLLARALE